MCYLVVLYHWLQWGAEVWRGADDYTPKVWSDPPPTPILAGPDYSTTEDEHIHTQNLQEVSK